MRALLLSAEKSPTIYCDWPMHYSFSCRLPSLVPRTIPDVAARATIALAVRVAESTSLRRRIEEASLGITLGQNAARSPHIAVVLEWVALVVIAPANSAAIWCRHCRQISPIEIVLEHAVVHAMKGAVFRDCLMRLDIASGVGWTPALGVLADWIPLSEISNLAALAPLSCARIPTA